MSVWHAGAPCIGTSMNLEGTEPIKLSSRDLPPEVVAEETVLEGWEASPS